jgi:hypothetical protein
VKVFPIKRTILESQEQEIKGVTHRAQVGSVSFWLYKWLDGGVTQLRYTEVSKNDEKK